MTSFQGSHYDWTQSHELSFIANLGTFSERARHLEASGQSEALREWRIACLRGYLASLRHSREPFPGYDRLELENAALTRLAKIEAGAFH